MTTLNAFKDGKEHGLWEHYLPDGQLSEKGPYNMGERCGKWTFLSGAKHYPPCPEEEDL